MAFIIGQTVTDTCTFTTSAGVVYDPSTIAVTYKSPQGTSTTKTFGDGFLLRTSAGIYTIAITGSTDGDWVVSWTGTTSGVVARYEHTFTILPSMI
jgi:hypothetical protein